jgi:hypothetical protein
MSHHAARVRAGLALFTALTLLGTWVVAATWRVVDGGGVPPPWGTRLLTTALLYAVGVALDKITRRP